MKKKDLYLPYRSQQLPKEENIIGKYGRLTVRGMNSSPDNERSVDYSMKSPTISYHQRHNTQNIKHYIVQNANIQKNVSEETVIQNSYEIQRLKRQIEVKDREVLQYQSKIDLYDLENERIQKSIRERDEQFEEMLKRASGSQKELTVENQELKVQNNEWSEKYFQLESKHSHTTSEMKRLQNLNEQAQKDLLSHKNQNRVLISQIKQTEEKLSKLAENDETKGVFQVKIVLLSSEVERLKKSEQQLQFDIQNWKNRAMNEKKFSQKCNENENEIRRLLQDQVSFNGEIFTLKTKNERLLTTNQELEGQIDVCHQKVDMIGSQKLEVEKVIRKMEAQLKDLESTLLLMQKDLFEKEKALRQKTLESESMTQKAQQIDGSLQVQNHQNLLLSSNIEDLGDKVETYVQDNLKLQNMVNERTQQNNEQSYALKRVETDLEKFQREIKSHVENIDQLQKQLVEVKQALEISLGECESMNKENGIYQKECQSQFDQIRLNENQIRDLTQEQKHSETKIENLTEKIQEIKSTKSKELKHQFSQLSQKHEFETDKQIRILQAGFTDERAEYNRKISQLNQIISEISGKQEEMVKENGQLKISGSNLESDLLSWQKTAVENEKLLQELKNQNRNLISENSEIKQQYKELLEETQTQKQRISNLYQERDSLMTEIQNTKLLFDEKTLVNGTLEENLQRQNQEHENLLAMKDNELSRMGVQVQERDREIDKLQDEMKLTSKRVVDIEEVIRELGKEKQLLISDNEQLSHRLVQQQQQILDLEGQAINLQGTIEDLSEEKRRILLSIEDMEQKWKQQSSSYQNEITDSKNSYNEEKSEKGILQRQKHDLIDQINNMSQVVQQKESEIQREKARFAEMEETHRGLNLEFQQLVDEMKLLNDKLKERERQVKSGLEEAQDLEKNVRRLNKEQEETVKDNIIGQQQNQQLKNDILKLKQKILSSDDQRHQISQKYQDLELTLEQQITINSDLSGHKAQLEQQIHSDREKHQLLEFEMQTICSQLESQQSTSQQLIEDVKKYRKTVQDLSDQVRGAGQKNTLLDDEIHRLKQEHSILNDEIDKSARIRQDQDDQILKAQNKIQVEKTEKSQLKIQLNELTKDYKAKFMYSQQLQEEIKRHIKALEQRDLENQEITHQILEVTEHLEDQKRQNLEFVEDNQKLAAKIEQEQQELMVIQQQLLQAQNDYELQLKNQNESFDKEYLRHQQVLSDSQTEIQDLRSKILKFEEERSFNEQERNENLKAIKSLKINIESYQFQQDKLDKDYKEEIKQLKIQFQLKYEEQQGQYKREINNFNDQAERKIQQLLSILEGTKIQLGHKTRDIDDQRERWVKLSQESDDQQQIIRKLEIQNQEIPFLKKQMNTQQNEKEQLQTTIQQKIQESDQLKNQIITLESQVQKIKPLQAQLEDKYKDIVQLQKTQQDTQLSLDQSDQQCKKLLKEIKEMDLQISNQKQSILDGESKSDKLNILATERQEDLLKRNALVKNLEQRVEDQVLVIDSQKQEITKTHRENTNLQEDITLQKEESTSLQQKIELLKENVSELAQSEVALRQQNSNLQVSLEKVVNENDSISQILKGKDDDILTIKSSRIEEYESEIDSVKQQQEELLKTNEDLMQKVSTQQNHNHELSLKLRQEVSNLEQEIQQLKAKSSEQEQDSQFKQREIQMKLDQIMTLKQNYVSDLEQMKKNYYSRLEQEKESNAKRRKMLDEQNDQSLQRIKIAQEDADKWRKKYYDAQFNSQRQSELENRLSTLQTENQHQNEILKKQDSELHQTRLSLQQRESDHFKDLQKLQNEKIFLRKSQIQPKNQRYSQNSQDNIRVSYNSQGRNSFNMSPKMEIDPDAK